MTQFIVHVRHHFGWRSTTAEGETFAEAAIKASREECIKYGLRLDEIPHRSEFRDHGDGYTSVVYYETSHRQVFGGWQRPGDFWFGDQVRQGEPDDCGPCGGSGVNFYNPFRQCWECGDQNLEGKGTGKRKCVQVESA